MQRQQRWFSGPSRPDVNAQLEQSTATTANSRRQRHASYVHYSNVQSVSRSSAPAVIPAGASASRRPSHRLDEVYGSAATDVSLASSRMWWLYARQRYPFPAERLHAHSRCQLAELFASGRASGGDGAGEQGSSPAAGVDGGAERQGQARPPSTTTAWSGGSRGRALMSVLIFVGRSSSTVESSSTSRPHTHTHTCTTHARIDCTYKHLSLTSLHCRRRHSTSAYSSCPVCRQTLARATNESEPAEAALKRSNGERVRHRSVLPRTIHNCRLSSS